MRPCGVYMGVNLLEVVRLVEIKCWSRKGKHLQVWCEHFIHPLTYLLIHTEWMGMWMIGACEALQNGV